VRGSPVRGFDAAAIAVATHAKTPEALLFMGRLLMEERIGHEIGAYLNVARRSNPRLSYPHGEVR
jgi:hypothetical protein